MYATTRCIIRELAPKLVTFGHVLKTETLQRAMSTNSPGIWYRESDIKFKCTACGKCCHNSWTKGGEGGVIINRKEASALAKHLKVKLDDFEKQYLEPETLPSSTSVSTSAAPAQRGVIYKKRWPSPHRNLKFVPSSDGTSTQCVFLKDKLCSVHLARPTQCRTYPFWPHVIESEERWKEERERCEGMLEEHHQGATVPADEVSLDAIIQGVDIESGGGYTHPEASEVLGEMFGGDDNSAMSHYELELREIGRQNLEKKLQ